MSHCTMSLLYPVCKNIEFSNMDTIISMVFLNENKKDGIIRRYVARSTR